MANVDAPNGLTPAKHLTGGTIRASEYAIADGATIDINSGDLCVLTDAGVLAEYVDATSTAVLGVFAGCSYTKSNGEVVYAAAYRQADAGSSTNVKAYVYDDPSIIYRAQTSGAYAANMVGEQVSAEGAGDTSKTNGRSIMEVNEDSATNPVLQIIGLVEGPDNAVGANAEVYVKIYASNLAQLAGTGV